MSHIPNILGSIKMPTRGLLLRQDNGDPPILGKAVTESLIDLLQLPKWGKKTEQLGTRHKDLTLDHYIQYSLQPVSRL
jgi:hypothetical protein